MNTKHSLIWMFLGQVGSFVFNFTSSVVSARYLTPYEVGVYAGATAVIGILSVVQSFGLQNLIIREKELSDPILTTAFSVNALMCLLLFGTILSLAEFGFAFLHNRDVQTALRLLSVLPLLAVFDFLPFANIERAGRFKAIASINTGGSIVTSLLTIALVMAGYSFMSIVYAQVIGSALNTIGLNIAGREHVRFRIGLGEWRRVTDFAVQMFAVAGVNTIASRFNELMVVNFIGLSAMGVYNRANNLNGLLWNNIHLILGRVLFTGFAKLTRADVSIRDSYLKTVNMITALLWPLFAGLAILSGPFIYRVYGERWLEAAVPVALIATSSILLVSITMTWELFAATGNLRTQTRIETVRALLSVLLFAGGCRFGLVGAASARVVDAAFAIWFYRSHLNAMTTTTTTDFLKIYVQNAGLTLVAVGPALLIMAAYRFAPDIPVPVLASSVTLGVVMWGAGLFLTSHPLMAEVAGAAARRQHRPS